MGKGTVISKKASRRIQRKLWCNEPGCTQMAETWYVRDPGTGEDKSLYLCHKHMLKSGYCLWCGYFCAGSEDFDFSPMPGYCYDCRDEIRHEMGEDDYDDWDDDHGFMNPYYYSEDDDQPDSFDWPGDEIIADVERAIENGGYDETPVATVTDDDASDIPF